MSEKRLFKQLDVLHTKYAYKPTILAMGLGPSLLSFCFLTHTQKVTVLGLPIKSYIPPTHPFAFPHCCISPLPIHYQVLTLSKNVPRLLTLSENQLFKQRRKKTGQQCGVDFKRISQPQFGVDLKQIRLHKTWVMMTGKSV